MRCPKCQKKNPPGQQVYCYFCRALLEPDDEETLPVRRSENLPLILIFIFMIVVLLTILRRGL